MERSRKLYIVKAVSQYLDVFNNNQPLLDTQKPDFLNAVNLIGEAPTNYDINGYLNFLQTRGALWIIDSEDPVHPFSLHARILTGISDDASDTSTTIKLIDPANGQTHRDFVDKFEA
jgi:hypothetical protein